MHRHDSLPDGLPTDREDAGLLQRVAGRDRDAFSLLYDRHAGLLLSITINLLRDRGEAEDALQEAFLKIWDRAGRYDPTSGKPVAWMITLTRNTALDRLRASTRKRKTVESAAAQGDAAPGEPDPPSTVIDRETAAAVRGAVQGLPDDQRTAISMAFFSGLTQTEIAHALNEPLGTVKARIRRGMLKMRAQLHDYL